MLYLCTDACPLIREGITWYAACGSYSGIVVLTGLYITIKTEISCLYKALAERTITSYPFRFSLFQIDLCQMKVIFCLRIPGQ